MNKSKLFSISSAETKSLPYYELIKAELLAQSLNNRIYQIFRTIYQQPKLLLVCIRLLDGESPMQLGEPWGLGLWIPENY